MNDDLILKLFDNMKKFQDDLVRQNCLYSEEISKYKKLLVKISILIKASNLTEKEKNSFLTLMKLGE